MLERLARISVWGILLALTACAASEEAAPAAAQTDPSETLTPASKETTDATGVTRWGSRIDASGVTSLHGYDSENHVRASYRFDKLKNEAGKEVVRVTRDDGPSVETFDFSLSKDDLRYWTKNIKDTSEFSALLKFAVDDLKKAPQGTGLTGGTPSLVASFHTLSSGGLTNGQTHLICTNRNGDSCELAGASSMVIDCGGALVGAVGALVGGATCELIVGCALAAAGGVFAVASSASCGKDIGTHQSSDENYCKCEQK
jgi:hypothetical protein